MTYRLLADLVLVVHLIFIAFVVGGGWLAWRWRQVAWIHLPAAAWAAGIEFTGWICPLTPLENWLRQAGGASGYSGGFVEHYLLPLVYPPGLTRPVQVALGLVVIAVNVAAYGLRARRRRRRWPPDVSR